MSVRARARRTPPSSTRASTPSQARSKRGWSAAGYELLRCLRARSRHRRRGDRGGAGGLGRRAGGQPARRAGREGRGQRLRGAPRSLTRATVYDARTAPRPGRHAAGSSSLTSTSSIPGRHRWRSPPRRSLNGVELRRSSPVTSIVTGEVGHELHTRGPARCAARFLVNAAGLHADELHRLSRPRLVHGHAAPRRADRVRQALAPACCGARSCPSQRRRPRACWSRPTVFGNVMLGPDGRRHRRQGRDRLAPGRGSTACWRRAAESSRRCSTRRSPPSTPASAAPPSTGTTQIELHADAALPVPRRHPVDRPHRLDGHRRGGGRGSWRRPV